MPPLVKRRSMGSHHRGHRGHSDEWLTPPHVLAALGSFDLDPCSPVNRPWSTAAIHYTVEHDGLGSLWFGRVWLNPPYGPDAEKWVQRLAEHGNGVALIFARTETRMFHQWIWGRAHGLFFFSGRLHFCRVDGVASKPNSGAPSVLVAYGSENALALQNCGLSGVYVPLKA